MSMDFDHYFKALTGHQPLHWQRRLYERFLTGSLPEIVDLPTGLGKTSILHLWLLALGATAARKGGPAVPRRLVYIVNRRTIVDQASAEARAIGACEASGTARDYGISMTAILPRSTATGGN